jgi:hypothetical protein
MWAPTSSIARDREIERKFSAASKPRKRNSLEPAQDLPRNYFRSSLKLRRDLPSSDYGMEDNSMRRLVTNLGMISLALLWQTGSAFGTDTTWDRSTLPRPAQAFEGVANRTLEGSIGAFPQPVTAPKDAPKAVTMGDTRFDIEAAGKAGLATIAFLCGGTAESVLKEAGARAIYRNPAHLLAEYSPTVH